jgi:hypothetical protein
MGISPRRFTEIGLFNLRRYAKVFLEAWRAAGRPNVPVATVGAGTAKIIAPEYAAGGTRRIIHAASKVGT